MLTLLNVIINVRSLTKNDIEVTELRTGKKNFFCNPNYLMDLALAVQTLKIDDSVISDDMRLVGIMMANSKMVIAIDHDSSLTVELLNEISKYFVIQSIDEKGDNYPDNYAELFGKLPNKLNN